MTLKQKINKHYFQIIEDKIEMLQQLLADLKESGSNETKSTAGDKHETALAMLQIEQANKRTQLKDALFQKSIFEKINTGIGTQKIAVGSLIKTNQGYFYLSIALGKALINEIVVIALSPQSPLGQKMLGLNIGDVITVNDTVYSIDTIE